MVGKKNELRTESDRFGELQIPAQAYWGAATARGCDNVSISGTTIHWRLIDASVLFKKAAALANVDLGRIDSRTGRAICQAADEITAGQWRDQFIVDPFQPGALYTHIHNTDEVLANRGAEIIGGAAGTYTLVHPDKHVALGQTMPDCFTTVLRVALLMAMKELEPVLLDTERLLRRKSLEFDKTLKVGRVNLQDGPPVTLGQEFNAFGSTIGRSYRRLQGASDNLTEVNAGGSTSMVTAEADLQFANRLAERLSELSTFKFKPAEDYFRSTSSMSDFVEFSSTLKELAIELIKIAGDVRLLNSGPRAGFAEITIPEVIKETAALLPEQLPDRTPPVLIDALQTVAFQVIGNDLTVSLSAQGGQLEGNPFGMSIAQNILQSADLLRNMMLLFNKRCITGITANSQRCREALELSGSAVYLISRHIGPEKTATLVNEFVKSGKSLRELAIENGYLSEDSFDRLIQLKPVSGSATTSGE